VRIHWTGSQRHGFVIRQLDKATDWASLRTAVTQDLAYLPRGRWVDVNRGRTVRGPAVLSDYPAPLGVVPAFVRRGARGARAAMAALEGG
jgi:glycosyl hydrolase family 31